MSKKRAPEPEPTRPRNRRVEEIFDAALDLSPGARSAYLAETCDGDDELRQEIEGLLEAERERSLALLQSPMLAELSALQDLHPGSQGLSGGPDLRPGMRLGRYQLQRLLGQGGMGTVFLAHDTRLHRRVAIKILHAMTGEMARRFLVEARTTARCKHDNIVVIHDVDEHGEHPYMVLEYLAGQSLRQHLAGMADAADTAAAAPLSRLRGDTGATAVLPVAEVLSLVIPVVRALVCAHELGIVHRDLKPENIFLCADGTIKVLDFGIAKVLTGAAAPDGVLASQAALTATLMPREPIVTAQGAILGTLPYMSPEQWGTGEIDQRADLWAMGIMLYELLAGRHPLSPLSHGTLQAQVPDLDLPMPGLDAAVPGLGGPAEGMAELAEIIASCLRKRKAERMHSAEALQDALESVLARLSAGTAQPMPRGSSTDIDTGTGALAPDDADAAGGRGAPAEASPPAAARPRRRPWRALALAGGIAALAGGLAALLAFTLWPRLSIPAFPAGSGGIVLAVRAGAGDALVQAHRTLCTALRSREPQAVRCVELPRVGVDDRDLARAASHAGASLIARLEGDHDLRLLPVGPAPDILSELPTLHIADAAARQHLPGILHPLRRALQGDLRFDALVTPPVGADEVGWRLAVLAWYLNILARNQQTIPPADLRSTMTRCRQDLSLADRSCALAHYVYTQLDPTPPDAAHWLDELLAHAPPALADVAMIERAAGDCTRDPERAEAAVLRMAARWPHAPCHLISLIGPATCLLVSDRRTDAGQALQTIAYPGDDVMAQCEDDLVAAALSERGQHNMLARRWQQAARDLDAAWTRGSHPVDLLNWAESLLHQRGSGIDIAGPIAAALDLRFFDAELAPLAAFLRWLATRDQTDAASILALYSASPLHASVLIDDESTLASLVCHRPEHDECRIYGILTRPKQPGAEDELQRLLVAG